ncbi:hypothetical protein RRF57_007772 [Xylaria bambusicola]|uniref:Uncharacterized protein n=1 Tax=Xylaria bambusicola TaxID=326684 RepID=A0AAN7V0Z2_9PEZI
MLSCYRTVATVVAEIAAAVVAVAATVLKVVAAVVVGADDGKNRWSQATVAVQARLKGDCWKSQGQCQQLRLFAGRESIGMPKLQVVKVAVLDRLHCPQPWVTFAAGGGGVVVVVASEVDVV